MKLTVGKLFLRTIKYPQLSIPKVAHFRHTGCGNTHVLWGGSCAFLNQFIQRALNFAEVFLAYMGVHHGGAETVVPQ